MSGKIIIYITSILLLLLALSSCTPTQSNDKKFACNTDSDCRISCQYGAVSKSWYIESNAISKECIDGCEEGRIAKCVENTCKAFTDEEDLDEYCTLKKD